MSFQEFEPEESDYEPEYDFSPEADSTGFFAKEADDADNVEIAVLMSDARRYHEDSGFFYFEFLGDVVEFGPQDSLDDALNILRKWPRKELSRARCLPKCPPGKTSISCARSRMRQWLDLNGTGMIRSLEDLYALPIQLDIRLDLLEIVDEYLEYLPRMPGADQEESILIPLLISSDKRIVNTVTAYLRSSGMVSIEIDDRSAIEKRRNDHCDNFKKHTKIDPELIGTYEELLDAANATDSPLPVYVHYFGSLKSTTPNHILETIVIPLLNEGIAPDDATAALHRLGCFYNKETDQWRRKTHL